MEMLHLLWELSVDYLHAHPFETQQPAWAHSATALEPPAGLSWHQEMTKQLCRWAPWSYTVTLRFPLFENMDHNRWGVHALITKSGFESVCPFGMFNREFYTDLYMLHGSRQVTNIPHAADKCINIVSTEQSQCIKMLFLLKWKLTSYEGCCMSTAL